MRLDLVIFLGALLASAVLGQEADPDRDGDGLSDFQEIHKYLTDPDSADSDGDGIPDGDLEERREYQYTLRSIVQVMRPVTIAYLDDDHQDVRVLEETPEHVRLEVTHYPYNTVGDHIGEDPDWREKTAELANWLEPGPTSDWTPALRERLLADLSADGIEVDRLSDRELVRRVSAWLLDRSRAEDGFTTFITAFDAEGRPYVPEEFRARHANKRNESGLAFEDQFAREMSATGMYEHRSHGSCTSTAIYLNGCLKALGIPTRTVLCIPVIDGSDPAERRMLEEELRNRALSLKLSESSSRLANSWASHTFNEVFVDGRWRRLNYNRLGQGILDSSLGLMTHVMTCKDWSEVRAWETIGRRQFLDRQDDVFGHRNPYSCIALSDAYGPHCDRDALPHYRPSARLAALHFTESSAIPADMRAGLQKSGRRGLMAEVVDYEDFRVFVRDADRVLRLEGDEAGAIEASLDPGCYWGRNGRVWIYVPMASSELKRLKEAEEIRARPRNEKTAARWKDAEKAIVLGR